ncbi:MAG: biotin/lipoyl-binding protein [Lewinellaceae bacterium]|nr:biotin/lipoyl-binding protein [Lewinellaceae bacterium]
MIQLKGIEPGKDIAAGTPGRTFISRFRRLDGTLDVAGLSGRRDYDDLFARKRPKAAAAVLIALLFSGFPVQNLPTAEAHGDEPHGPEGNHIGSDVLIPKETQFLFDVTVAKSGIDAFAPSITLFGTIIPGAMGKATIQSPFAGRLRSVRVKVGEQVKAGQVLAIVEQSVDAGTSINWQSERNAVDAAFTAAKKDYERLNNLSDIVAKRDLDEATARLQQATENRDLFNRLYQDSAEKCPFYSPDRANYRARGTF